MGYNSDMKSLYRRCRPTRLEDVIGQPQVTQPLIKSLEQGRISHAYLFIGPRGCGKTSVARILAHTINGFDYQVEDDYIDIIEIDGASNRGIDNIRELREKVLIAPSVGKYKVYIIDEVHMLTKEAFNALLKTLEEPPAHAVFIMATTDAYKVPVTITSRAQTFTFKLADSKTMTNYLSSVCESENIKISAEAIGVIAKRGGGSFRDSLSLLDQISTLSEDEITKEMVVSALGLPQDEKIEQLLNAYESNEIGIVTDMLKNLFATGIKPETLAEEMINQIVEHPKPALMPLLAKLPDIKSPYAEAKILVAMCRFELLTPTNAAMSSPRVPETNASMAEKPTKQRTPINQPIREVKLADDTSFDWDKYTAKVQELNDAVFLQLKKAKHELIGNVLHIYPGKRIVRTILSRDNNKRILIDAGGGRVKITIHDENDIPENFQKDEFLDKMSDIMGGEVTNDGGGNPF